MLFISGQRDKREHDKYAREKFLTSCFNSRRGTVTARVRSRTHFSKARCVFEIHSTLV